MRTLSKVTTTTFCLLLCGIFPLTSQAQTYCSNLGSLVICDGGRTTITPLSPYGGVITQEDGLGHSSMTPYIIMPAPNREPSGVRPLTDLDRLDTRRDESRSRDSRSPFDLNPSDGVLLLPE